MRVLKALLITKNGVCCRVLQRVAACCNEFTSLSHVTHVNEAWNACEKNMRRMHSSKLLIFPEIMNLFFLTSTDPYSDELIHILISPECASVHLQKIYTLSSENDIIICGKMNSLFPGKWVIFMLHIRMWSRWADPHSDFSWDNTSWSMWVSHVTHMNESCHMWVSHVTYMHESWHMWVSHVTYMHESCRMWVSHVTHMHELCHMWVSYVTHTNASCHTWMSHDTHESWSTWHGLFPLLFFLR